MKHVSKVVTADGVSHDNVNKAARYLDKEYDKQLSRIGCDLSTMVRDGCAKHCDFMAYVDQHLEQFVSLVAIKADYTEEPKPEYQESYDG